jgi:hypothetical protein
MKIGTEAIVKAEIQRDINISIISCIFHVCYTNFSKVKLLKENDAEKLEK